jgi:hypothetical protein
VNELQAPLAARHATPALIPSGCSAETAADVGRNLRQWPPNSRCISECIRNRYACMRASCTCRGSLASRGSGPTSFACAFCFTFLIRRWALGPFLLDGSLRDFGVETYAADAPVRSRARQLPAGVALPKWLQCGLDLPGRANLTDGGARSAHPGTGSTLVRAARTCIRAGSANLCTVGADAGCSSADYPLQAWVIEVHECLAAQDQLLAFTHFVLLFSCDG